MKRHMHRLTVFLTTITTLALGAAAPAGLADDGD